MHTVRAIWVVTTVLLVYGASAFVVPTLFAVVGVLAADSLRPRVGQYQDVTRAADCLTEEGDLDRARVATRGAWQETHLLCYRVGCQYRGKPKPAPVDELAADLRSHDVSELLVWRGDLDLLDGAPLPGPGTDPAVYRVGPTGLNLKRELRLGS